MVPLLTGWARLDQHSAHGTSLVAVVVTGLVGALVYGTGASVAWSGAAFLAAGAVPAAIVAARSTARISASTLRRAFGVFLLANAVLLQLKGHVPVLGALSGSSEPFVLVAIGLVAGGMAGLLGVGGGAVMVPALALGPGFVQQLAQGTSLAAMVPSGTMGVVVHARLRHVRGAILPWLLAGSASGSWIGSRAALALPGRLLAVLFSGLLVWLGLRYLRRAAPESKGSGSESTG
jgi:hypothetical protein